MKNGSSYFLIAKCTSCLFSPSVIYGTYMMFDCITSMSTATTILFKVSASASNLAATPPTIHVVWWVSFLV